MYDFFYGKTIAIVGASGFIGSKLVERLNQFNCTILRVSRNISNLTSIIDTEATIKDIAFPNEQMRWSTEVLKADIIYYFSAQTSVYTAKDDIITDYSTSVLPILSLLEQCKNAQINPIIVFSSAATVFGLTINLPVNEDTPTNPLTIYDIHKLLIENYLSFYSVEYGIRTVSLRLCNVYGAGVKSSAQDRGILNKMAIKALAGEPLSLYGDGSFIRDYIYIDDAIEAFLLSSKHINKTKSNRYILGSGEGHTLKEVFTIVVNSVKSFTNVNVSIKNLSFPKELSIIEKRNFVADSNRFINDTEWSAKVDLNQGIMKMLHFFNEKV